jgi:integrase
MTGCRSGEMKLTQWDDINWESKEIVFPATNTKAKRAHRLPLPDLALEVLTDLFLSRTPAPWIFPANRETGHTSASGHIEEPKIAWNRIREAAGVPKCRIHDLRHTLASHMAQAGHTMDLIRRILNHKDSSITARYAHLDTETMRKCLNQTIGIMLPNGLTAYVPPQDTVTPGQPDEVQVLAGEPVA